MGLYGCKWIMADLVRWLSPSLTRVQFLGLTRWKESGLLRVALWPPCAGTNPHTKYILFKKKSLLGKALWFLGWEQGPTHPKLLRGLWTEKHYQFWPPCPFSSSSSLFYFFVNQWVYRGYFRNMDKRLLKKRWVTPKLLHCHKVLHPHR